MVWNEYQEVFNNHSAMDWNFWNGLMFKSLEEFQIYTLHLQNKMVLLLIYTSTFFFSEISLIEEVYEGSVTNNLLILSLVLLNCLGHLGVYLVIVDT